MQKKETNIMIVSTVKTLNERDHWFDKDGRAKI